MNRTFSFGLDADRGDSIKASCQIEHSESGSSFWMTAEFVSTSEHNPSLTTKVVCEGRNLNESCGKPVIRHTDGFGAVNFYW